MPLISERPNEAASDSSMGREPVELPARIELTTYLPYHLTGETMSAPRAGRTRLVQRFDRLWQRADGCARGIDRGMQWASYLPLKK